MKKIILACAAVVALASGAHAQSNAQTGATQGASAAGPIGALVGGTLGAATDIAGGMLQFPGAILGSAFGVGDLRSYIAASNVPSQSFARAVRRGAYLPRGEFTLYEAPKSFGVPPRFTYAVVNNEAVLVNRRTRRIVQILG